MNIIEWVKNLYKRVWRSLDDTSDDTPVATTEPEVEKTEVVKKKKPENQAYMYLYIYLV